MCNGLPTASAIYFSIKPSDNILKLKKDEFKIELGERISKDAAYYLDTKDLSKEEAKEVIEKSKVNVPKIKKVGNYKIKISYDIQSIEAKLKVIDTVPSFFWRSGQYDRSPWDKFHRWWP